MAGAGPSAEYDGFISYAHAADGALAPQLQAGLQRFAKPWWRRRALRIFRDESGLSANPHLWTAIAGALDSSAWLVLLLSPDAAGSDWVGREITHWLQTRPADRILPVLTEGDLVWDETRGDFDPTASTAIPPALFGVFPGEPRWVDLRWAHSSDQVDLGNPRFRAAIADIAAPLHGIAKDDLESEEVRQHRRTRRTAWTAITALTALTLASIAGGALALQARQRATAAEMLATAQARTSDASRLGAEALGGKTYDLSLLLAAQAVKMDPSPQTESNLFATLLHGDAVRSVRRTDGTISSTLMSPDGRTITTLSDLGRMRTWPLDAGRPTNDVKVDRSSVPWSFPRSLAWLPDGRLLADTQDGEDAAHEGPRIVEPVTGALGHVTAAGTNGFALSPDGSALVAVRVDDRGSFSDTVVASRVAVGEPRHHSVAVGSQVVWVTRCGRFACVLTTDKQMVRVRFGDGAVVSRAAMPPETIVQANLLTVNQWFASNPDGSLVAAPCSDNVIRLVDPGTGRVARVLGGTTKNGSVLAFSPDGLQVAGRDASTVLVWHLDGAPLPERYDGHGGRVNTAAFTRDGTSLVTTGDDDAMIVWDLSGAQRVGRVLTRSLGASTSSLWAVGSEIAVGQSTGSLVFVDPATGAVSPAVGGSPSLDGSGLTTVRSGTGSDRLIAANYSGRTTIWSLREHRLLTVVTGLPELDETHLADTWVSNDGRYAATSRDDTGIRIIDMATGRITRTLAPIPSTAHHTFFATVVGWTSDGTGVLAFRQTDDPAGIAELFILDATTGAVRMHRYLPWTPNEAVEDPAGRVLAVGGDSGQIAFLDPGSGDDIAPSATANDLSVYNMSSSPDGRWFSASGGPPQVTLWDARSYSNVGGPLPVDVDARDARARFASDGELVVTTGGTLRSFTVDPTAWMTRACAEAGRTLTQDEWNHYLPGRPFEPACP
jgi:WD40 repeat protein